MYYPLGWPKVLRLPQENVGDIRQIVTNRDRILTALLTSDSLLLWYVKPSVPIISHRRSQSSIADSGENQFVHWKPDSSSLVVITTRGFIIIYHLVVQTDIKSLYELIESRNPALKRELNELFIYENIPPLIFSLAFEIKIEGEISNLVTIRDELMIATKNGNILRYSWDGHEVRDYSLSLKRIPFCMDQQVLKAVPITDSGMYVRAIEYSPLLGGYALVFNDGRAAFLVASTQNFDPNSVTGIWAIQLEDATTVALNHKYKLIVFGRQNSEGVVYNIDEMTGGLTVVYRMILPTHDYPGCPGSVTNLRWTPDGIAIAMTWSQGGFSIWSTFGTMIMCSLCWDYGNNITNLLTQNPLVIKSMDWTAEGYQLWVINAEKRLEKPSDPDFMPFPSQEYESNFNQTEFPLANKALIFNFAKSPISVNPCMSKQKRIYLQGEDNVYINLGWNSDAPIDVSTNSHLALMSAGAKIWSTISIPHNYIATGWPIRYTALDDACEYICVAGRHGFAHYSLDQRKWRLFGNESQEKDFIVTGGLLWAKNYIVMGCYNLSALQDEIRIYPKDEKLDNMYAHILKVESQVLLINVLNDSLIVFSADSLISIYSLLDSASSSIPSVNLCKLHTFDATRIPGFNFHPACVLLVALSNLRTEISRSSNRDSLPKEFVKDDLFPSIILNVCGRVFMIQTEERLGKREITLPTILASNCETIWFPRETNSAKPHLTGSLWLYCGYVGMRVWLPVFPREGDHAHNFMSKRIMLHFPLQKFYPIAILFENAIILGAESDSILFNNTSFPVSCLPYSTIERNSVLFLHPILRQLIRRNLGFHAWEIARTCTMLSYFSHSLELLLHEVLEEEATSTEPIPDALLPSVVEFIQEFPVYHKTIGRCARKTEVALWPHLFAVVGSPRTLFMECLTKGDLETAATYLIIIQNLEPVNVAQNHATELLNSAITLKDFKLAKELIRFLRSIDPNDIEEATTRLIVPAPYGMTPQTPPLASAPEDEISILLGTLQVPRARVTTSLSKTTNTKDSHRSHYKNENKRKNCMGTSQEKETLKVEDFSQSAEDFFIDVILQRHARDFLSQGRLFDLGTFAAELDFHIVTWLKKETSRAARVNNAVAALNQLHMDFNWPYPSLSVLSEDSHQIVLEDKFRMLNVDLKGKMSQTIVADSGYLSHTRDSVYGDSSEEPTNAELKPLSTNCQESESIVSGDDITSFIDGSSGSSHWMNKELQEKKHYENHNKASHKSEVQLRYLLQMMLEADCFEIASCISVILRDSLALIRIVNTARSPPTNKTVVSRLYQNIKALEAWAQSECHGYIPFFNGIQPQINSLKAFLMQPLPRQSSEALNSFSQHTRIQRSLSAGDSSLNNNKFHQPVAIASSSISKNSSLLKIDDTSSVGTVDSDILPEGQDEQSGCSIS